MKILIGYDGSECAYAALDDLTQAALPPTGEAHILSVAEVWLPPPPPSTYEIIEGARNAGSPAELQRDFAKHCAAALKGLCWAVSRRRLPLARIARLKLCARESGKPNNGS